MTPGSALATVGTLFLNRSKFDASMCNPFLLLLDSAPVTFAVPAWVAN